MDSLTQIVRNIFSRDGFFFLGNLLSIISFFLTIFVLLNIRKLRNTYKLRVRGPSLIKDLSKSASNLSGLMNDYSEFLPQITEELGKVGVKLRSLRRKLSGSSKRSVKHVITYIDQCEISPQNEAQVRRTYVEIVKVIEELKDNQKDLDWEL
ncbi:MAG TPA: hypothetical protein VF961_07510 [Pyrinomonadaceae bacterium]